MKKIFFQIIFLCTMMLQVSFAQSPDFFNYQAAIRGSNGNPLTGQNVSLRISILEGSSSGSVVFQETFQTNTDDRGLVAIQIGNGTLVSGDFQMIEWGPGTYFLQIEVDENGGSNYQLLGSSQLVSVPYSKYADTAGFADGSSYADSAGSVRLSLGDLTDTNVPAPQNDYVLTWNGTVWTGRPKSNSPWVQIGAHEIKFDSSAVLSKKLSIGKNVISAQVDKDGKGSILADRIVAREQFRFLSNDTLMMQVRENSNGAGELLMKGPNGSGNVKLSNNENYANRGFVGVMGPSAVVKASMEVNANNDGVIKANRLVVDAGPGRSPLEALVGGSPALKVYSNGGLGVSLGSNLSPPADGLKVAGPIETLNGLTADNGLFIGNGSTTLNPLVVRNIANQVYLQVHASNGGVSIGTSQTPPAFGLRISQDLQISSGDLDVETGDILFGDEYMKNGGGGDQIIFSGHLVSFQDNVRDLGASGKRWREVFAANGVINTSDLREKKNILDLGYGLDEVMKMRPVSFNWKNPHTPDVKLGLIAQDLMEIVPEVVKTHDWETGEAPDAVPQKIEMSRYGVYYSDLIPVLIKSIQEQQQMIEDLKQRITQLENN